MMKETNEFKGVFTTEEIKEAEKFCKLLSLIEYRFEEYFDRENFYETNCVDKENAMEMYDKFNGRKKLLVDMISIASDGMDAILFVNSFREASTYIIEKYDTHFLNDEKRNSCLERLEKLKG